jgi:hypothetical protein
LSFAVENGAPEQQTEAQIAAELQRLDWTTLLQAARGIDRGVVIPAVGLCGFISPGNHPCPSNKPLSGLSLRPGAYSEGPLSWFAEGSRLLNRRGEGRPAFINYPTAEQQQILSRWIGCQRFIYSAKVGEDRYFRRFSRKSPALCGIPVPRDQQYAHFITEQTAFLREVPAVVLRNGAYRWRRAYQRFFSGGLPGPSEDQTPPGPAVGPLTRELFELNPQANGPLLKVGTRKFPVEEIRTNAHHPVGKAPASVSLSVEAGQWPLSFAVENGAPEQQTEAQIAAEPRPPSGSPVRAVREPGPFRYVPQSQPDLGGRSSCPAVRLRGSADQKHDPLGQGQYRPTGA